MQINSSSKPSSVNFKSRCASIKDAQDVCRAVRNNFPYMSYSKAACEASNDILKKPKIYAYIIKMNNLLKRYRADRQFITKPANFYKEVLYSTIKEKVAACYDLAVLGELILKMNGIKNCGKTGLVTKSGQKINHCVTYVQLSEKFDPKKMIIIDPWLQEVDFLPNMLVKYKNHFKGYLLKKNINEDIRCEFKKPWDLKEEELKYFKEKYPQLLFKKELFAKK